MCSLCRLPVAKNHNFGQILTFWGLLYGPPFTDEGQIWYDIADRRSTLICRISSECVHCLGFQLPKTTILGNILTFGGLLYRPPFTSEDQIWCATADPRYLLIREISSGLVYSVALLQRKTQNCTIFWTSVFCAVATRQQIEKVEHGCTTTNLPLSNGIKVVSVLQRLHGKMGAQTLMFNSVMDRQSKLATREIWAPPKLMIEDMVHVLAPQKLLGSYKVLPYTVSPLGVAENLGEPDPLNLKPP